ncbi:unnamed protein product [Protopolystoma xenopodis]|uniref:Pseudouridine synthase RsuA/RluA-like domain-containing protein n=1 Tax=Protopolystoma xenopodis TaxID=117903 RepID=A0A3S5BES9_9PLAT|nr:unnamed protein product [Protopolystoma xenopodis]
MIQGCGIFLNPLLSVAITVSSCSVGSFPCLPVSVISPHRCHQIRTTFKALSHTLPPHVYTSLTEQTTKVWILILAWQPSLTLQIPSSLCGMCTKYTSWSRLYLMDHVYEPTCLPITN